MHSKGRYVFSFNQYKHSFFANLIAKLIETASQGSNVVHWPFLNIVTKSLLQILSIIYFGLVQSKNIVIVKILILQ